MTTVPPRKTTPKRSRARSLLPPAVLVWIALEIWLLVLLGEAAGVLVVLLVLVAGVVFGSLVVKTAGRRAFENLRETVRQQQQGGVSAERSADSSRNGFLMLGGLLLIVPGLITDAAGLLLLVPPLRSAVGRYADRSVDRRIHAAPGGLGTAWDEARRARMRQDGNVVQGEVVKDDAGEPGAGGEEDGPKPPLTR